MAAFDIFDTIGRLRRQEVGFCVATVLRTADATSAKAGAKAAITRSGDIVGHLGGACVLRAVRRAADEALSTGRPLMIRVRPAGKVVQIADPEDIQTFDSGCPSGGSVDLLIEPYRPAPRLVIFGDTPIARALATHAVLAGLRVCVPSEAAEAPPDATRFDGTRLADLALEPRDFVVVASQGQGDSAKLRAALDSPARRVSMVASRRKAQTLCDRLIAQGTDPARAARLKSPAGLDLGGPDPHEIAISILAEIIRWRNADTDHADSAAPDERTA